MPLTLEQYADLLDARTDLTWPAPPAARPAKARPSLQRLPEVRAVLWNVYGTLLCIPLGELAFEHPQEFIMSNALEKTIQEFRMWGSMSRKPGQPSEYMSEVYSRILEEHRVVPGSTERYPEASSERVWEAIIKRLVQKDYTWDTSRYGSLNELARKVAYFFHASLQGVSCQPGAAAVMRHLASAGVAQGLLSDGQCFTTVQLSRALRAEGADLSSLLDSRLCALSYQAGARKPSERIFRKAREALADRGLSPEEVLHVGSSISRDLAPAKRLGMRTALYAGDKTSLQATAEQLKEPSGRPDVLLTQLDQLTEVLG
jgi:FMN phosphatase YigB (HAD superfamily)